MPWGLDRRFLQCVNIVDNIVIATRPEMGCADVYAGGQSQCGGQGAAVVAGLNSLLGQCAPASAASADPSASATPGNGSSVDTPDQDGGATSDVTMAVPVPAQLDIAEIECRLTYSPLAPGLFVCRPSRDANG